MVDDGGKICGNSAHLGIDVSNLQISHCDDTVHFELKLPLLQHLTVIIRTLHDIVPFLDHLEIPKLGYW